MLRRALPTITGVALGWFGWRFMLTCQRMDLSEVLPNLCASWLPQDEKMECWRDLDRPDELNIAIRPGTTSTFIIPPHLGLDEAPPHRYIARIQGTGGEYGADFDIEVSSDETKPRGIPHVKGISVVTIRKYYPLLPSPIRIWEWLIGRD